MKISWFVLFWAAGSAVLQVQAAHSPATSMQTIAQAASSTGPQQPNPPAAVPSAPAAEGRGGYLEPSELKALLHKIWLAEYRINDLLSDVHSDKWKMPQAARNSFNQTFENLRKGLASQEAWRAQFETRPESVYLGYETFVAMIALLPRLDGVGQAVAQFENRSLGAQYSQAEAQLFDLQQALQPYLEYLLHNQDQLMQDAQGNLAACQDQLGLAMRNRTAPATPMKNYLPEIKGHGRVFYTGEKYPGGSAARRAAKHAEKNGGEKPKPSEAGKGKPGTPAAKPHN